MVRHLHRTGDPLPADLEPLLKDIRQIMRAGAAMIVKILSRGKSFKGLATYLTHDPEGKNRRARGLDPHA